MSPAVAYKLHLPVRPRARAGIPTAPPGHAIACDAHHRKRLHVVAFAALAGPRTPHRPRRISGVLFRARGLHVHPLAPSRRANRGSVLPAELDDPGSADCDRRAARLEPDTTREHA